MHTYAHKNQTNSNERNFHPAEWESRHVLWKRTHTHHASNSNRGNWIAYGKNPWPCGRFFVCASFCFSYLLHSHFLAGSVRGNCYSAHVSISALRRYMGGQAKATTTKRPKPVSMVSIQCAALKGTPEYSRYSHLTGPLNERWGRTRFSVKVFLSYSSTLALRSFFHSRVPDANM